ncbi:hypothetical protein M433DRAFT_160794 [Acidomyces richmondensis BFW]|nr:hypothetical protein M433DRAFT_160794 [Acidomyces richmondensis BFW]
MEQANRDTKKPRKRKIGSFKNNGTRGGTKKDRESNKLNLDSRYQQHGLHQEGEED